MTASKSSPPRWRRLAQRSPIGPALNTVLDKLPERGIVERAGARGSLAAAPAD